MRNLKILLLAATIAVVTGCASGSNGGSSGGSLKGEPAGHLTEQTPAARGSLTNVTWDLPLGEPTSLDWIYDWDYGSNNSVLANMCESLLRQTPSGQIVPALAQSVSHPNPTTYVYSIRSGVKFADGHPMTTSDVVYSLSRQTLAKPGPGGPSYWQLWYDHVKSIKATGPMQVSVTLKQPDVLFNEMMSTPAGIVAEKSYVEARGAKYGTAQGGVMCTGPYAFSSWTPGNDIVLTANKYYWDSATRPHAAQFTFKFITSDATLTNALTTGSIDGVWEPPLSSLNTLSSSGVGKVFYGPGTNIEVIQFFSLAGALGNADIRRALMYSVDYKGIVNAVLSGHGAPAKDAAPSILWGYARSSFQKAYNALPTAVTDVAKAKQIAPKNAPPIVFAVNADNQEMEQTATAVQSEAAQVGLTVKLRAFPTAAYNNLFFTPSARKGIDGTFSFVTADAPDPLELLIQNQPGSPYDYTNYRALGFAQPLLAAVGAQNPDQRATLLNEATANYVDNVETLPIYVSDTRLFMNNRITGPAVNELSYLYTPWAAAVGAP
jgi:peptide/nickel transport system substrate-binding protein